MNGESYKTPATIEDIDVLEIITKKIKERGFGVKSGLIYLEDHQDLKNLKNQNILTDTI